MNSCPMSLKFSILYSLKALRLFELSWALSTFYYFFRLKKYVAVVYVNVVGHIFTCKGIVKVTQSPTMCCKPK